MSEVVQHETVGVPVERLKLAAYNPRIMPPEEMERLKHSLSEFGFVEPCVVRAEDLLVIGGHQRVAAYRALGGKGTVPCTLVKGLSDERAKLLNVALNRIGGEWDYVKLSELLKGLDSLDMDELLLTGFGQKEIEDILALAGEDHAGKEKSPGSLDDELAAIIRRFEFEVATQEEADLCRDILRQHGMTGPANGAEAFVKVCKAAMGQPAEEEAL
jgi:hypothetical protein